VSRANLEEHIIPFLQLHVGSMVNIAQVADVCPEGTSRGAIQSAMKRIEGKCDLEVITRGSVWRFQGDAKAQTPSGPDENVGKVLEVIRTLKTRELLLECEDGRLFRATEVKL
jgi:hypothetical protein